MITARHTEETPRRYPRTMQQAFGPYTDHVLYAGDVPPQGISGPHLSRQRRVLRWIAERPELFVGVMSAIGFVAALIAGMT